jgi:hypothetical protein
MRGCGVRLGRGVVGLLLFVGGFCGGDWWARYGSGLVPAWVLPQDWPEGKVVTFPPGGGPLRIMDQWPPSGP